MLYDTHCHLNCNTDEELKNIISRSKQADLKYIMCAGTKIEEASNEIRICNEFSDDYIKIFCGVADHPEETRNYTHSVDEIIKAAKMSDKVKAIGETGLDTHIVENMDFLNSQILSFENHIEASLQLKLPLIIHVRGEVAISKTIEILTFYKKNSLKAVIHSYTDGVENVRKLLDIDCYISFSGVVTFKNADNVRDAAKVVPIDRMLVETDAPFLAPVPMRGKQNEASFVKYTADYLSNFLNIDYNKFCETTTQNAIVFFNN